MFCQPQLAEVSIDRGQTQPPHQVLGVGVAAMANHAFGDSQQRSCAIRRQIFLFHLLQPGRMRPAVGIGNVEPRQLAQRHFLLRVDFAGRNLLGELDGDDNFDRTGQRHLTIRVFLGNQTIVTHPV